VSTDAELIAAAAGGDERAFRLLVEPRTAELHAHCYRMLGSTHDADDALQEVLVRAWRSVGAFEGRSTLRRWLFRIATNVCLTMIEQRSRRVLPVDLEPGDASDPAEPVDWLEPYPEDRLASFAGAAPAPEARYELRESVELAFVAALQHVPPNQRAVLILREVLGFSAREVADVLGTTTASANSALQRARDVVRRRVPAASQQATLRALGDDRLRELVNRYMRALENHDVDGLVALLTDDATWSMPPVPTWYRGLPAITAFLLEGPMRVRWRHVPAVVNGQQAVGCYEWDDEAGCYVGAVLDVLTLRDDRIAAVTAFLDPRVLAEVGLPERLPA
jgi:RNA polymerase sigma-70 factor, ECF subfamily